jgi:cytochrome c-type biogenesis protein CcsB
MIPSVGIRVRDPRRDGDPVRSPDARRRRTPWAGFVLVLAACLPLATAAQAEDGDDGKAFHEQVDLDPLGMSAVLVEGRLKSFGSHASSTMHLITGPRRIGEQSDAFTYLDMLIRPEAYADADVVYVKNKNVRQRIADVASAANPALESRLETSVKTGLFAPSVLRTPEIEDLLRTLEADLVRTARPVTEIRNALTLSDPRLLLSRLRLIPPTEVDPQTRWHGLDELVLPPPPERDPSLATGLPTVPTIDGLDPELASRIRGDWREIVEGWRRGDATQVNAAVADLAAAMPGVNTDLYPEQARLQWEHWYFEQGNLTWIWLVYLASTAILLVAVVYRWPTALKLGLGAFGIALALQTFAVGLRWYVAGRWPNSNMFEAVTTAAWFGAVAAIAFELWVRRTPLRGFFALGAAVSCMVALMSAHFLPVYLNPNIGNMMPVLHDVWLYIHTNVIIFSYCLIFMAAVTSGIYLAHRLFGGLPAYARAGGTGMVLATTAGAASGGGAVSGGTGSGEVGPGGTGGTVAGGRRGPSFGEVLDGVTMVLMELSFVMLWAGLVMGAIWADHSWGRPWGWDPKEVFALETFVVFLLLVHVRWRVKDKGFWTAILALVGAAVMLFNWIVVNFVITGLHSYA